MKSLGLRVKVNSVLTRWNENEIEDLLALCDELDVLFQIDPEVKPKGRRRQGSFGDRSQPRRSGAIPAGARSAGEKRRSGHRNRVARRRAERQSSRIPTNTAVRGPTTSRSILMEEFCPACSGAFRWATCTNSGSPRSGRSQASSSEIRETTKAARRMIEGLGDAAAMSNFCPGAAHVHSGDPLALYPAAEQRIAASARARVRLTVL